MFLVRICYRVLKKCSCNLVCNLAWGEKVADLVPSYSSLEGEIYDKLEGGNNVYVIKDDKR